MKTASEAARDREEADSMWKAKIAADVESKECERGSEKLSRVIGKTCPCM